MRKLALPAYIPVDFALSMLSDDMIILLQSVPRDMAGNHEFRGYLSNDLVASISFLLDKACVPYFGVTICYGIYGAVF